MDHQRDEIVEIGGFRRLARNFASLLLLPLLVAGCLQVETTVRVERDGSGTLTERFLMGHQIVEMFEMMSDGETFDVLDEAELRDQAAGYGEKVRFLSAQRLETEFGVGYEVRYGFEDVAALRLDPDPSGKVPDDGTMGAETEDTTPSVMSFALRGTEPAELLIHWPIEEEQVEAADEPATSGEIGEPDPEMVEMMRGLIKGMRMAMHVEVAGEIVETNATHREGTRITLADIALGDMLSDDALKALVSSEPSTLAEVRDLVAIIPGLSLELQPEVLVRFR